MLRLHFALLLGVCLWWAIPASAQPLSTQNKKAQRAWQQAWQAYQHQRWPECLHWLQQAVAHDSLFTEAWYLQADIYAEQGNDSAVVRIIDRVLPLEPSPSPVSLFMRAKAKRNLGQYLAAVDDLRRYKMASPDTANRHRADQLVQHCLFAHQLVSNPVPFRPQNLGPNINTSTDEYWPSLSADERTLVFTRLVGQGAQRQEDFYLAQRTDSAWLPAQNLGPPTNTVANEGAQTLSADGKTLVYTACGRPDSQGSCDLYIVRQTGSGWSQPRNLGAPINSRAWESQPALSADGKQLYFVSNRPGGFGNKDIWVSRLLADSTWSPPQNLGDSINTPQDEAAPYLHPDGQTLYFASNGHMGLGYNDVFMARRLGTRGWSRAVNLGYPINTQADERGLVTDTQGHLAYMASARDEGFGGLDLYTFELPPHLRPQSVTYVKGLVTDTHTRAPLQAKAELIGLLDSARTVVYAHPSDGQFLIILAPGQRYALNVWRRGYLFYSDHFDLVGTHTRLQPFELDIRLQPVHTGARFALRNVFFDTDKAVLKPESEPELQKLIAFLHANPKLKIEIEGHTDNQGTAAHNLRLSDQRARAVVAYLQQHQIDIQRLSYQGYGAARPLADNNSPAGRAQNRRTEVRIVAQ